MNKKTKIAVLIAVAAVVVVLAVILIIAIVNRGSGNAGGSVSIDQDAYNKAISTMTPTDAASVAGSWILTDIKTAQGGKADAVEAIGKEINSEDKMRFEQDGSFSNYIGGLSGDILALTGTYTLSGSDIALTYGNGATATATFDNAKQILTVKSADGAYIYTLYRQL